MQSKLQGGLFIIDLLCIQSWIRTTCQEIERYQHSLLDGIV